MTKHRHGVSALVALLLGLAFVGLTPDAANAQRNCQPWLTAARQEAARGNTQMAAEGMRIYDECVRQAWAAAARAGTTYGRNLHWVDPQYYGSVLDSVANPVGPRVVKIPGYRPNLVPGRPPGPMGGQYPGSTGQTGGSSACPGGCPPGTGTGVQPKSLQRSAYGQSGAAGFAGRNALSARTGPRTAVGARYGQTGRAAYGARTTVGNRSAYAARSAAGARTFSGRYPAYSARSPYAARSAYGAGGRGLQYRRPMMGRGLR